MGKVSRLSCLISLPVMVLLGALGALGVSANPDSDDSVDPAGERDRTNIVEDIFYPPPAFDTFVPPEAGGVYVDPTFDTVVRRLTDARGTPNRGDVGTLPLITHEYATMSPFNADNSRLLLVHLSYFALYDGQGRYLRSLPFSVNASSEPRWSRTEPNHFYYNSGNQLRRFDISRDSSAAIVTFSEYSNISGLGESEISFDGDHRVLVGDGRDIFVYSMSSRSKGPVLRTDVGSLIDNVFITPDNNVLITWYSQGKGRRSGIEMYDSQMRFIKQVTTVQGHMDVARDRNGEEVLLWTNSADPDAPEDCNNAVVKIRLSDLNNQCLLSLDWGMAVHISAPHTGDWFVVSTYTHKNQPMALSAPPEPLKYRDEILRIRLDGSEVQRLAHHRSRSFDAYSYQPKASVSRDGRFIIFTSNKGLQARGTFPDNYTDVYLIDVHACNLTMGGPDDDSIWYWERDTRFFVYRVQEFNDRIRYSGQWSPTTNEAFSGDVARASRRVGDRMDYQFEGSAVSWVSYTGPESGRARVSVNGIERAILNTRKSGAVVQDRIFTIIDLPPGTNLLTIEVLPAQNGVGQWVWIDALDSLPYSSQDCAYQ